MCDRASDPSQHDETFLCAVCGARAGTLTPRMGKRHLDGIPSPYTYHPPVGRAGWAYHDANGRPLRGPCHEPECRYASEPGGDPHAGRHSHEWEVIDA